MGCQIGPPEVKFLVWEAFVGCGSSSGYCSSGKCSGVFIANIGANYSDIADMFLIFWEQTINAA